MLKRDVYIIVSPLFSRTQREGGWAQYIEYLGVYATLTTLYRSLHISTLCQIISFTYIFLFSRQVVLLNFAVKSIEYKYKLNPLSILGPLNNSPPRIAKHTRKDPNIAM